MPSGASPLRLGALCIGVEGYTHLSDVECAARDACALDVRINATPFGSSSFIRHSRATSTGPMLLRAIRTRLQELAEREDPPESFLFYYGGHVLHLANRFDPDLLHDTKTFLVPASSNPRGIDDCQKSCLGLMKLLNVIRKDLCEPVSRRGKKIVVLVVLDAYRRVLQGGTSLVCDDFSNYTTPEQTAILVSHQRTVANHDRLHSPFTGACLDSHTGLFADNISVAQVLSSICQGQDAAIVGLDDIPKSFCFVQPDQPPDLSDELRTLLQNWKLEGQAHILIKHGIFTIQELEAMQLKDAETCGFNIRMHKLLDHVQTVAALRREAEEQRKGKRRSSFAGSTKRTDHSAGMDECEIDCGLDTQALTLAPVDNVEREAASFLRSIDTSVRDADIDAIVGGMDKFSTNTKVQEACAKALLTLASGNDDLLELMVHHGVIQRTVCVMRLHPSCPELQEACVHVVDILAAHGEQVAVFAGGIERTVAAMQAHNVVGLQAAGCRVLRTLALRSTANQILITRTGGVKGLLVALKSSEQLLHKAACAALLALSCTPALEVMISISVPKAVKNVMNLPDVADDTKSLGRELLNRLRGETLGLPSPNPATSPTRGARLAKGFSAALALEDPSANTGAANIRKSVGGDDVSALHSSPSPKPLQQLSRRRSDPLAPDSYPKAKQQILLRLPKVEKNTRSGAAVEGGIHGLGMTMQSAGSRAREIFSSAGSRLSSISTSLPFVGSLLAST